VGAMPVPEIAAVCVPAASLIASVVAMGAARTRLEDNRDGARSAGRERGAVVGCGVTIGCFYGELHGIDIEAANAGVRELEDHRRGATRFDISEVVAGRRQRRCGRRIHASRYVDQCIRSVTGEGEKPVVEPEITGVKVTPTVQLPSTAIELQAEGNAPTVDALFELFVLMMLPLLEPLLVNMMLIAAPVVFTVPSSKFRIAGLGTR
jgi:hypothetical protein